MVSLTGFVTVIGYFIVVIGIVFDYVSVVAWVWIGNSVALDPLF